MRAALRTLLSHILPRPLTSSSLKGRRFKAGHQQLMPTSISAIVSAASPTDEKIVRHIADLGICRRKQQRVCLLLLNLVE